MGVSCSRHIYSPAEQEILNSQNRKNVTVELVEKYANASENIKARLVLACANSENYELIPGLQKIYENSGPEIRKYVAFSLSQFDKEDVKEFLKIKLLNEKQTQVREQIVFSLGKIGGEEALSLLLTNYRELKIDKKEIIKTIGYYFDRDLFYKDGIEFCFKNLNSADEEVVFESATALSRLEKLEILQNKLPVLLECYSNSNAHIQIKLVKIINKLDFPEKSEFYKSVLENDSHAVKIEALQNLKYLEDPYPIVKNLLKNSRENSVLASTLKNLPPEKSILKNIEENLIDLVKNHVSRHVKGLAYQNLITLSPTEYSGLVEMTDYLLQYKIEGFSRSGNKIVIDSLYKYSHYNNPQISTPAFSSLLYLTKDFVKNNAMSRDSLIEYIIFGLESFEPVKITLAAQQIPLIDIHNNNIKDKIYNKIPYLIKINNTAALLEIIETIEYLYPQDAIDYLWTLSRCDIYVVSQRATEVLTSLYDIKTETEGRIEYNPPKARNLKNINSFGSQREVKFETEKGDFVIQLAGQYSPYTCSSFLKLVKENYYDGLTFHRVVPNFVVQGGDPRGDGWGGPDYNLLTEISMNSFTKASVGMANAGPNTEGSQFFITTTYQPHLDYNYTYLGEVVKGMEVVKKIEPGDEIISAKILP